jgi:hypothetical protein
MAMKCAFPPQGVITPPDRNLCIENAGFAGEDREESGVRSTLSGYIESISYEYLSKISCNQVGVVTRIRLSFWRG